MALDGLRAILCAALLVGALPPLSAAPGDDPEAKLRTQLAVQKALQEGKDHLKRGNYQAAVFVLESQITRIDGSRQYLDALRDAYRGYVRELQQAGRLSEVPTYLKRLAILDPGSHLDHAPRAPVPAPKSAPTAPPAALVIAAPAPPATPGNGVVARGKLTDPFSEDNSRRTREVPNLLTQADREFDTKHYEEASRLYARANRLDAAATAGCLDRWAYCKLHGVVQALNGPGRDERSLADLEHEVHHAVSLAPKLEGYAQKLLRSIEERQAATGDGKIEVRHSPRQSHGWAVAETANFRVFHNESREVADKAARVAEATRAAMSRKWFGDVPATWAPRCDIYLHHNTDDYARSTGASKGSPGHSSMQSEGERVFSRRIDLRFDNPYALTAVLPHETTHVVLVGRFGRHHVPRWADEGMAVLSEPRDRIEPHLRNLPRHRSERDLFPVGELMRMANYPEARRVGPFYAQGVSLVDFLTREKGPRVFTQFLRDGLDTGYEAALERHYGIRGFAELDRRWQAYAFGGDTSLVSDKGH